MTDIETSPPKRIRVVVVDDSEICRESLKFILEADADIVVVGEAEDGFSAMGLIEALAPDLVTMDVQMPGKSGLETVAHIMARHPVPIIVVTAARLGDEGGIAFVAIENGALDVVAKPSLADDEAGADLRNLVRSFAVVPVFRQLEPRFRTAVPAAPAASIVAVVAGRGGIASVLALLARLPERLACPVVIHEPVPAELVPSYSRHLAKTCKLPVRVAAGPEVQCVAGEVLFVPALRAEWTSLDTLKLEEGATSATEFLRTVAAFHGAGTIGVVLAGSGDDGAAGLMAIKVAGGATFAESPTVTAVSGMPMAAIGSGAADTACNVERIVSHALTLLHHVV